MPDDANARWQDAVIAAALFAVDPVGTGGVCLTALPGPARDAWTTLTRELWPAGAPWRRVPLHVGDDRLLGGLDLAATLAAGRPVCERGILADADGGVVVLAMAERLASDTAARIHAVLDAGAVVMERDGVAARWPTHFGIIAIDEGSGADETPPAGLIDRLAFHVDLDAIAMRDLIAEVPESGEIVAARARLATVTVDDAMVEALVAAASALGIVSLRAPSLALRVARAAAALAGRIEVDRDDAALAARLVLAPRATRLPLADPPPEDEASPPADDVGGESASPEDDAQSPPPADNDGAGDERSGADNERPLDDVVLAAAQAAIPAGLIALLEHGPRRRVAASTAGRSGAQLKQSRRGHVIGAQRGDPRQGARLAVIATLRAAAPWQAIRRKAAGAANRLSAKASPMDTRRKDSGAASSTSAAAPRIEVRREDFHVVRRMQRRQTTTIFAVDASGSTALHRLAEAKGAVELLLADCYVRRDHVALLAFRGRVAELLLPPTRSLVRAKRCLAALPGGGGTPLAAGIDAAMRLAETVLRRGETPVVVFLTDGRANIARDGTGGRVRAEEEALAAAHLAGAAQLMILVVDTSPQPHPLARTLADAMGARYLPLPYAGAAVMSAAVRGATEAPEQLRP